MKKQMARDVRREADNYEQNESEDDLSKGGSVRMDDSLRKLKLDKTIPKE